MEDVTKAGPADGKDIPDVRFAHSNNAEKNFLIALDAGTNFHLRIIVFTLDAPSYLHHFAAMKLALPDDSWKVNKISPSIYLLHFL